MTESELQTIAPLADRLHVDSSLKSQVDQAPLHSPAAEKSLLACALLENSVLDELGQTMPVHYFYCEANRLIYRTGLNMRERGDDVDIVTLADELGECEKFREIGGAAYLLEIVEAVPYATHFRTYERHVKECAYIREVCYAASSVLMRSRSPSADSGELWSQLVTTVQTANESLSCKFRPDVDLDRRMLSVTRSLEDINGKMRLKEPKSKSGRRQISLPEIACQCLKAHKIAQKAEGLEGSTFVFPDSEGGPLRKSNFHRHVWVPLRKAIKMETLHFHDLRHASATMMLSEGIHPKIVQERLGHANIAMTMDIYSHVMPTMQAEAAGKFDRLLATEKSEQGTNWVQNCPTVDVSPITRPGFEPGQTEPKSVVLPLHYRVSRAVLYRMQAGTGKRVL
jgi:hypothetical protein